MLQAKKVKAQGSRDPIFTLTLKPAVFQLAYGNCLSYNPTFLQTSFLLTEKPPAVHYHYHYDSQHGQATNSGEIKIFLGQTE